MYVSQIISNTCSDKLFVLFRSAWQGMLVVAAFIEQVVVQVNSRDQTLVALTLKHCSQLQRVSVVGKHTKIIPHC